MKKMYENNCMKMFMFVWFDIFLLVFVLLRFSCERYKDQRRVGEKRIPPLIAEVDGLCVEDQ